MPSLFSCGRGEGNELKKFCSAFEDILSLTFTSPASGRCRSIVVVRCGHDGDRGEEFIIIIINYLLLYIIILLFIIIYYIIYYIL